MSDNAAIVQEIAKALSERNTAEIRSVVAVLGVDRARELVRQALEVEAQGGMMTANEKRRRTPGGVFFHLVRVNATPEERKAIFPAGRNPKKKRKKRTTSDPSPAAPVMTWDEAKQLIAQAIKSTGEARTVKLTLIGRPLKVIQQKDCVVVSLKGSEPKTLPRGLPPVPEGSAITWAVFIVNKQWNKVKDSIEKNQNDSLIVEGYPIVGKGGVAAVMVTNCKSMLMERAGREQG